jgi:hypothetical protein
MKSGLNDSLGKNELLMYFNKVVKYPYGGKTKQSSRDPDNFK